MKNPLEKLWGEVVASYPEVFVSPLLSPLREDGIWSLDIKGTKHLCVEWSEATGFMLSTLTPDRVYGEGPDEIIHTLPEALRRIQELLV